MREALAAHAGNGSCTFRVSTGAQPVRITPRVVQIDRFTCADLLAQGSDLRDRRLIFMNGYINSLRGQKVWDEQPKANALSVR